MAYAHSHDPGRAVLPMSERTALGLDVAKPMFF